MDMCDGAIGIINNIIIHGKNDAEHDQHLCRFMHISCDYGLVLNPEKNVVNATSVSFFGSVYDAQGVHPDPDKVSAIHAKLSPESVTQL